MLRQDDAQSSKISDELGVPTRKVVCYVQGNVYNSDARDCFFFFSTGSWKQHKYLSHGNGEIYCDLVTPGGTLRTEKSPLLVTMGPSSYCHKVQGEIIMFQNTNIIIFDF